MQYNPHSYQQRATDLVVEKKNVGLFLDMGLGKTRPSGESNQSSDQRLTPGPVFGYGLRLAKLSSH